MTWEYRCVKFPFPDDFSNALPYKQQYLDLPGRHTDLLNELGAEGWEWMHAERDLFYFRREAEPSAFERTLQAIVDGGLKTSA